MIYLISVAESPMLIDRSCSDDDIECPSATKARNVDDIDSGVDFLAVPEYASEIFKYLKDAEVSKDFYPRAQLQQVKAFKLFQTKSNEQMLFFLEKMSEAKQSSATWALLCIVFFRYLT